MKKILFTIIAIIFVAVLSSCAGNVSNAENAVVTNNEKIVEYTEIHASSKGFPACDGSISSVQHFKYKNHKYIQFTADENSNGATGGVVHDPDCSCNK